MKSTVTRIPTDLKDRINEIREEYRNNPFAYTSPPIELVEEVKKPNGGRNYKNTFDTYTVRIPDQLKPWVNKIVNDFYRDTPMPEAAISTVRIPSHLKPIVTELINQSVTTLKPVTEEPVNPPMDKPKAIRLRGKNILEYQGEAKPLQEWCQLLQMRFNDVRTKLYKGMPVDEVFAQEQNRRG